MIFEVHDLQTSSESNVLETPIEVLELQDYRRGRRQVDSSIPASSPGIRAWTSTDPFGYSGEIRGSNSLASSRDSDLARKLEVLKSCTAECDGSDCDASGSACDWCSKSWVLLCSRCEASCGRSVCWESCRAELAWLHR